MVSSAADQMQPAVVPVQVHLSVPLPMASTQAPAAQSSTRFVALPLVSSKLLASLPSPARSHSAAFAACTPLGMAPEFMLISFF